MRTRAILLGLLSLGLFALAGPANAEELDKNKELVDRAQTLKRQLAELEAVGKAAVLKERGVRQPMRPAVTTSANVETFEPVTAQFLRFNVTATINGGEPCLHTLEITGPDFPLNLMSTAGLKLTASSVMPAFKDHLKDGKYAPPTWCWVSGEKGKGWLQIELPTPATMNRVVWSRDAANKHHDRIPTHYQIQVSEDGRTWKTVATGEDRVLHEKDYWVSREAMLNALDKDQGMDHQNIMAMLRKLGGSWPNEIKSGPQVGENVTGAFASLFLNGLPQHAGKQRCPV